MALWYNKGAEMHFGASSGTGLPGLTMAGAPLVFCSAGIWVKLCVNAMFVFSVTQGGDVMTIACSVSLSIGVVGTLVMCLMEAACPYGQSPLTSP